MTEDFCLHILRNPYSYSEETTREARLKAADLIESYKSAYLNMRDFAEKSGLNTTCTG